MSAASIMPVDVSVFPTDFVWGAATAAYQIEGAVDVDGRTTSIWDTFSHSPGRVQNGDTGDLATDHYNRLESDLDLMEQLGLGSYRFSVSWPRVQPRGAGPANARGLDFYRRLVDGLLDRGVKPWLTLYHWDLPQELEDAGGWPARDTASRFAEYAALVADALGDRVENWTTLNEPWCSAFLGYGSGHHAPGRRDPAAAVEAAHHLLLGHGLAVQALRARGVGKSGLTLNLYPVSPASDEPGDLDAARRIDGLHNRLFLDSIFRGRYPDDVLTDLRGALGPSVVKDGDLAVIAEPLDLLGVNYYFRHVVAGGAYPGVGAVDFINRGLARTAMGWEIDPTGLIEVLTRVHADYTDLPIYVTENGAAFDDEVTVDGIDDLARTAYLAEHIDAAAAALEVGVPLKGYFVWSLLDNFEWAWGYEKRFGIVHVDYPTQRRAVKSSGRWYADLIRQHRSVAR